MIQAQKEATRQRLKEEDDRKKAYRYEKAK
jgi:hypothetical protein